MDSLASSSFLYARAVKRVAHGRVPSPLRVFAGLDGRIVFVFGCPRSGTTFLAGALGQLRGYVDLGEVAPLKAAIPLLAHSDPGEAAPGARRILTRVQRLALAGGLRAVEQTPESVFIAPALKQAYPDSVAVHLVRDGRDVVCSLLERGWLSAARGGHDDAGQPYGAATRFWVEPERASEFGAVSDTRRAAWAWRRYAGAGLELGDEAVEVRYETLTASPADIATRLAQALDHPIEELATVLAAAHPASVGRHRAELTDEQLAEVEDEAGPLLRSLGYV